jgi:predicted nucleic acid-binding protein
MQVERSLSPLGRQAISLSGFADPAGKASAAVRLILADPAAADLAERVGGAALVLAPELMLTELANTLWKLRRADRLNDLDPQELLAEALALACHLNHPVYDCLYLALARREAASLISSDRRLNALAERVLP